MLNQAHNTVNPSQTENCQPLHIFIQSIHVCIFFVNTIHMYAHMHIQHEYIGLYKPPWHYPLSNTISKLRNKTWDSNFVTPEPGEGRGTAELSAGL